MAYVRGSLTDRSVMAVCTAAMSISLLLYAVVLLAVRWIARRPLREAAICAFAASWGNVGYIGVPLLIAAYGEGLARKVVSRIGAVVAPRRIGASTLAAMAVPAHRLEAVAERVNAHAEVNHDHLFVLQVLGQIQRSRSIVNWISRRQGQKRLHAARSNGIRKVLDRGGRGAGNRVGFDDRTKRTERLVNRDGESLHGGIRARSGNDDSFTLVGQQIFSGGFNPRLKLGRGTSRQSCNTSRE